MTTRCRSLGASLLTLVLCSGALGDDAPTEKNVEAVNTVLAALAKAYNARDPKAIAGLFTPQGEFVDADANVFDSHETIAAEFAALFANDPKKNVLELAGEEIREISPGVLSVDCIAIFSDAVAGGRDSETVDVDFSALVVKQPDGNWLLASVRSEGEGSVRSPHSHLKRLEWLIGEWMDENQQSTLHTKTRWSDDGNFLLSDFTIQIAGRKRASGTQRIGWDESLGKFKSWIFDSAGGHAEGIWTEFDDIVIVKVAGVHADGAAYSATQTYTQTGADSFVFAVTDRIIGDEVAPDFQATVVHKPPALKQVKSTAAPRGK
ncbi:MAG TPA: SgcJ/EcaC family oxidoreductase [Pirellulales bacterium]|nr:SgcJ/EcaC family oxidoreductase [Pirellulales bacterium]